MAYAERHTVSVTTDASGDSTDFTSAVLTGRVLTVIFDDTDLAAGADFTITGETTGQTILSLTDQAGDGTFAPRQATHATDGSASLFAGAGEPVEDYIWVVNERIKIVTAQGGNAKSGSFTFIVG